MKKRWLLYFIILIISSITTNISTTIAYFNTTKVGSAPTVVELGSWTWIKDGITIEDAPTGTFDLDEFIEEGNLNVILPLDSYFMYQGNLYQVTSTTGYNPQWHDLPSSSSAGWAFISLMLDWVGAHQRYNVGAVVRIDNRYFQAMHLGNTFNPLTNHGPANSGKPWREIEPMEDYMFPFLEDTQLRDYSNPYPNYVVQKY